ncbi:helix-hairpin-helix domain-containing protein [Allobranchiibius sp. GilTou73]|uniref:helix-hairpin-helix domain-containing protein n=1 Tax=Allobranchiibius sp. GilTou73 TaxID=2904523 RepID=UPI001F35C55D|nr:ComEA family DNA-binding protein [Allobranchiibius sp. GilTou73]UIJ33465.1 ComEA family DNA-binding protein [Allobranchiibius sp. GilTou73]
MPRVRAEQAAPDRLAAVLDELDAVRRPVGWVPTQESLLDSRRPAIQPAAAGETRGSARLARRGGGGRHAGTSGDLRPHAPLLRTPAALRDAQVAPSRLAVLGVLIVVLVAGLVLGGRVLLARASATSTPVAAGSGPRSAATTTAGVSRFGSSSTAPSAVPTTSAATTVVVQVVGQVRHPGVVTLRAGARVQDAVAAAGGALPSADLTAVNLARVVTDGEQIQVPKPGQTMTPAPGAVGGGSGEGSAPVTAAGGGSSDASAGGVINLNTADVTGLDALPGVGPVLAQRIVDWRTQNGRFTSVDELGEVSGIGDKVLARLRPHVTV